MKTVHVPFGFFPDPVGGTEVYVAALARELQREGMAAVIAAPGEARRSYVHDALTVHRFPVAPPDGIRDLYGEGDPAAAADFGTVLDRERPDLVHLHAFTRGVSMRLAREASCRGIPIVFTYHTPTVSCPRGTLLRWGRDVCDGRIDLARCTPCALHGHGVPRFAAEAAARLPQVLARRVAASGLEGGVWTALRMRELVALRTDTFRALMDHVDVVVALADWTRDLLVCNGVAPERIAIVRHGIAADGGNAVEWPQRTAHPGSLRIAALGRADRGKGFDVLIRAIRACGANIEADLYLVAQSDADANQIDAWRTLAAGDARIRFLPPLAPADVVSSLRAYDLVAVPSQIVETGPLVVLEAFAAGVPVVGSRVGGIAEMVRHEVDGLLVESDSPIAWRQALERAAGDPSFLVRMRQAIAPVRRMRDVAREMLAVYERCAQVVHV